MERGLLVSRGAGARRADQVRRLRRPEPWAAANSSIKVAAAAAAGRADFCLVNGDLGYAMGSAWIWDSYMQMVEVAAASTPHLWQVGNHESSITLSRHLGSGALRT